MHIILASQSPRRRELLEQVGLTGFTVRPARGEERAEPDLSPEELVEELSRQKAREVAASADPDDLVIAADTVVAIDGQILGKPRDPADARRMLTLLSGRTNMVCTGVTVCRAGRFETGHEVTAVRFRPLSQEEISAYVSSGEPMDKAGAYGIQGLGALLVEGIEGDYGNVVGLPLCRLGEMLSRFGVDLLSQNAQKERAL